MIKNFIANIAVMKAAKTAAIASPVNTTSFLLRISFNGIKEDIKIVGIESSMENLAASTLEIL